GVTAVLDTVKTGADGTFSVGQLQAGNYRVTISAEGYRAFTQRNVNVEDDEVTVDAELRPSGSAVLTPLKYTSRTNGVFVQNNKLLVQSMAESAVLSLYSVNGVLIYREKIQKGLSVIDLWQITSGKSVVSILNAGAQRYVNTFLIP
ncbi:MAG TPA: carboxypeptidase-like regulatory domain-containing protein, partial [Chitinispirillaceae bacterium]|nr:carboxypeptidase-like regulatory domain-containing protein [Chitinispirillaceae bacterium]